VILALFSKEDPYVSVELINHGQEPNLSVLVSCYWVMC